MGSSLLLLALTVFHGLQQIGNWYTNHGLGSKGEESHLVKVGKQWTARLVVDYLCHDEIKEIVSKSGDSAGIGVWSTAVTEMFNSLSDDKKMEYTLIAEEWRKRGPPLEVKRQLVFQPQPLGLPY